MSHNTGDNPTPNRMFPHVPRPVLTMGAVLGGIIGIILSDQFSWSAVESFIITVGIALVCVVAFAGVYSLIRGRTGRTGRTGRN